MTIKEKLKLCWRILKEKEGNLLIHADRELPDSNDGMQRAINRQIKELLLVFSTQGHSGFTAAYVKGIVGKLLGFEPLGPLTGEPEEWRHIEDDRYQNNRCSHVFLNKGQAYDIKGKIFREPNGVCYTNKESSVDIKFPYTPKTEYVDVDYNGKAVNDEEAKREQEETVQE